MTPRSAVLPVFLALVAGLLLGSVALALAATSSVGRDGGRPVLRIDGRPVTTGFVEVYYYPAKANPLPNQPEYRDPRWGEAMRRVADTAVAQGVRLVMASVWWGDIDVSTGRPARPEAAAYDFAPLDAFMDYARKRGVAVILKTSANHFLPGWWLAENGFPPGVGYQEKSACPSLETDAYGTAYGNPSMGSAAVRRDFGAYVAALVGRYRSHPALAGWAFGLGPTGEDGYGPNYIVVDAPGGGKGLGRRPLMFTDYSPDFTVRFRDWLAAKYGSEAALRRAWNDPAVSLAGFRTPPPAELVRDPAAFSREPFPDPAMERELDLPAVLTAKGLDFYAFRVKTREDDTDYYARLIKSLDPGHVLLFNGRARASLRAHPSIDGIFFNPHPRFGQPLFFETNQLDTIFRSVEAITVAGKLALVASENGAARAPVAGRYESAEQINYLVGLGRGVKALGGIMGYAVDLLDVGTDNHWLPTWFSGDARAAMRTIETSRLASGQGPCEAIRELRRANRCGAGGEAPLGCGLTDLAFLNYCQMDAACDANRDGRVSEVEFAACRPGRQPAGPASPTGSAPQAPQGQPAGAAGKCGDGVCDAFEQARGVCPADCGGGAVPTGQANPGGPVGQAPAPAGAPLPTAPTGPGQPGGAAGKCGDGVCDAFERARGVCPGDCGGGAATTGQAAPGAMVPAPAGAPAGAASASGQPGVPAGKCGDGVCDAFERSRGVCPQDCPATTPSPATPGNF
jgi:hypothetical protein